MLRQTHPVALIIRAQILVLGIITVVLIRILVGVIVSPVILVVRVIVIVGNAVTLGIGVSQK